MAPGFPLLVNGIRVRTSEALYQTCRFPHLPEVQRLIIEETSPMTAKMKTKHLRDQSRPDWDSVRVKIMRWAIRVKLAQNWDRFSLLLLSTRDEPIVEESRKDDFWGAHPNDDEGVLIGRNVLGRLLMELRGELRVEGVKLRRVEPLPIPDFLLCGQPILAIETPGTDLSPMESRAASQREAGPATSSRTNGSMTQPLPTVTSRGKPLMMYPKRLIEVDLPIKRISAHARREKSIRHGHISTLHIWWARRPLAACRAVICAALWPDPAPDRGDAPCPEGFVDAARREMLAWTTHERQKLLSAESRWRFEAARQVRALFDEPMQLRGALLDFIADFANWDNSTIREFLDTSRALTQAAHEALGGAPGTRPLVVDPFAGGGSIPLEALRVGADSFASDLNPIPVLLNKVVLEYIPKYGNRLAAEVRRLGAQIGQEVERELDVFFPKDEDGATPIAYLWARTIRCEGPGCGVEIPLLRSTALSKRAPVAHVDVEVIDGKVFLHLRRGLEAKSSATIRGGKATCPKCGYTTPEKRVKVQTSLQRGGAEGSRLFAVLVQGPASRRFREPNASDLAAVERARDHIQELESAQPDSFPTEEINPLRPYKNTVGVCIVTRLGIKRFRDLYTARQLCCLLAFQTSIKRLDAERDLDSVDEFAVAVMTILYLTLDRVVNANSSLSRWNVAGSKIEGLFSKQALQVIWDFAEANPTGPGMASWDGSIEWVARVLEANTVIARGGTVERADARNCPLPDDVCDFFFTDPPYFAAIPYADLSDVFYVWLRRSLAGLHSKLFETALVEKARELIVTNSAVGASGQAKDAAYFTGGMTDALASARRIAKPEALGCVVFADSSTSSWEAILNAVISSGWTITASWPIDTELQNRTRASSSASLQSSIFMICRPRENPDGSVRTEEIGDWREVLGELPRRIHGWMPRLAEEGVVGADAIFACIGPALEIFSRYSRVEKASGDAVTLNEYLEHVWAAVAREALSTVLGDGDSGSLEPDARLAVIWLWTLGGGKHDKSDESTEESDDEDEDEDDGGTKKITGGYVLEFDAARKIAQGLGAKLEELTHVVAVKGDKARLLPVSERAAYLFGKSDAVPVGRKAKKRQQLGLFAEIEEAAEEQGWGDVGAPRAGTTTLDRVNQAMLLFASGRSEALKRFLVEDGVGKQAPFWKLAQALSALYPGASDEKRWVDGVLARKKGLGFG